MAAAPRPGSNQPPRTTVDMDLATSEKVTYHYPNRMGRIVLVAMEEVLGRHGVNAVCNLGKLHHLVNNYPPNNMGLEFTFDDLGAFNQALDEMFGPSGGRCLSLRAGRETWRYALNDFVPILGITDLARRALPLSIKLKIGLDVFAETFNRFSDQIVRLSEDNTHYLWRIERCPLCWQRQTNAPCCHLAVGLLQQSLQWVSNGRQFHVEEIECVAQGDANCVIAIRKRPVS